MTEGKQQQPQDQDEQEHEEVCEFCGETHGKYTEEEKQRIRNDDEAQEQVQRTKHDLRVTDLSDQLMKPLQHMTAGMLMSEYPRSLADDAEASKKLGTVLEALIVTSLRLTLRATQTTEALAESAIGIKKILDHWMPMLMAAHVAKLMRKRTERKKSGMAAAMGEVLGVFADMPGGLDTLRKAAADTRADAVRMGFPATELLMQVATALAKRTHPNEDVAVHVVQEGDAEKPFIFEIVRLADGRVLGEDTIH